MGHVLYFDVATSRFFTNKKTNEPPYVLRVAWWRDDHASPECYLIRPVSGMTIDHGTFPYHGLTLEQLAHDGVDASVVVSALEKAAAGASAICSFHQDYHWRSLYRLMGVDASPPEIAVCVMKLAEPILAIPAMRPGGGFKAPSLKEACAFFDVHTPELAGDPIKFALDTVQAVRGVYEACLLRAAKQ